MRGSNSWRGRGEEGAGGGAADIAGRRVDEVVRAPPNMKGGLVVIRSFCRSAHNDVIQSRPITTETVKLPGGYKRDVVYLS